MASIELQNPQFFVKKWGVCIFPYSHSEDTEISNPIPPRYLLEFCILVLQKVLEGLLETRKGMIDDTVEEILEALAPLLDELFVEAACRIMTQNAERFRVMDLRRDFE